MPPAAAAWAAGFQAAFRARRRRRAAGALAVAAVMVPLLWLSVWVSEAWPSSLAAGLPRVGDYFYKLMPHLRWGALLAGPETEGSLAYWFYRADEWLWLLFETTQMAALATVGGAAVALALCFPAASTLSPRPWVYWTCRRLLDGLRSVPDLVYALIFVWAVGVGPLAGIGAILLHTAGSLGKLFAEMAENADLRPLEAVQAAGGSWVQGMRYAILPQVAPLFVSQALMRFEMNVRGAAVIGFVGAGGIGQELYTVISLNYGTEISAILILIVLTASLIDLVGERVRTRLMRA